MAKLHGKFGKFSSGGGVLTCCNHWSLSTTGDAEEATDFNSGGWKDYLAGCNGFTASAEGWFDTAETQLKGNPPAFSPGLTVALMLAVDATLDYTCNAIITGVDFDCSVNGNVTWKATFQGVGPITTYAV